MPPPMPGPCPPGAGFSFSGTSVMRHSVVKSSPAMEAAFCSAVDRKSTRLNSSHLVISYAVFCLKKKKRFVLHQCVHHLAQLFAVFPSHALEQRLRLRPQPPHVIPQLVATADDLTAHVTTSLHHS